MEFLPQTHSSDSGSRRPLQKQRETVADHSQLPRDQRPRTRGQAAAPLTRYCPRSRPPPHKEFSRAEIFAEYGIKQQPARHLPMRQSPICPQWYDRKENDRWNRQTNTIPRSRLRRGKAQCFVSVHDHVHGNIQSIWPPRLARIVQPSGNHDRSRARLATRTRPNFRAGCSNHHRRNDD